VLVAKASTSRVEADGMGDGLVGVFEEMKFRRLDLAVFDR
jgi:hypothetical protein